MHNQGAKIRQKKQHVSKMKFTKRYQIKFKINIKFEFHSSSVNFRSKGHGGIKRNEKIKILFGQCHE